MNTLYRAKTSEYMTIHRKPSFKKKFAVGFPISVELATGNVFSSYDTIFLTDKSKMGLRGRSGSIHAV